MWGSHELIACGANGIYITLQGVFGFRPLVATLQCRHGTVIGGGTRGM
jgi:hypothetical protein